MTAFLAPDPIQSTQFIPGGNTPASGAQLFCYQVGSTTKQNTYTDPTASTARTNPIVLDSGGNIPGNGEVWIASTAKFVLAPSNDTDPPVSPYWSRDNLGGINDPSQVMTEWIPAPQIPVFVNASTFILGGDQTNIFTYQRRIRTTNTSGLEYGAVTSSVFGTSTTIGIVSDSIGMDSGLSAVFYSLINPKNTSLPEPITLLNYTLGTPTQNASALTQALTGHAEVIVPAGTYDNCTVSTSNRTLKFERGVTFRLPDNTITGTSVVAPAVLGISGDNITLVGDFTIDGNRTTNATSTFPTSDITGALNISGNNCRIEGTVTVTNAAWRGVTVSGGNNSGQEVQGFYCDKLRIDNSSSYAVMLWSVIGWKVGEIEVNKGTTTAFDARVRLGSQSVSTAECKRGEIGFVRTNGAFVTEANTRDVHVDSVFCGGGKLQETANMTIDSYRADGSLLTQVENGLSLSLIGTTSCSFGSVIVTGHNSSTFQAVILNPVVDCNIEFLYVKGTQTNVTDFYIGQADGLHLGTVCLVSPVGTGDGFFFDVAAPFAPQRDIVIGELISRGHTTNDVLIDSGGVGNNDALINIRYINPDAKKSMGTEWGPSGTFLWSTGTSTQAVNCSLVTSTSIINVTPIDAQAGVIMNSKGYFVTVSSKSFTIHTGDGSNTGGNSNWVYTVPQTWTG